MAFSTWLFRQFRFVVIEKYIDTEGLLRVLDVGCGLLSPVVTRQELKNCTYWSIDMKSPSEIGEKFGVDVESRYRQIDLETGGLKALEGLSFDVIVISHVLEHLNNGLQVLEEAVRLVAPGGLIFVEYPRLQSVNLPSMDGTLNFHDDPTHKAFYSLVDIANTMVAGGLIVRAVGVRRLWRRILLMPLGFAYSLIRYRKLRAGLLWDVLGFAEFAVATRRLS